MGLRNSEGKADILLVEDNRADVDLVREAFLEVGSLAFLNVTRDGADALAFLRGEGQYAGASRPDLILLDLNLPKKSGCEVLKEVRADERLKMIPVVVLTTSEAEYDIRRTYELGANCYITKPSNLEGFFLMARRLHNFWLEVVKLPPKC